MIVLPLPPSLNHAYITRRGSGQRIKTVACRKYQDDAKSIIMQCVHVPHDVLISIEYQFYWPDNRRRDVDNALKIVRDCLVGTLVKDDCWRCIPHEHIHSRLDRNHPRLEITYIESEA